MADENTTVEFLRDAAATRVEATSLRGVAREIGISPTGLKKIIASSNRRLYAPTLRRLRKWYVFHYTKDAAVEALSYEMASAAVAVLVLDLSHQVRPVAVERVLDALASAYTRGGVRATWMNKVKAEYGLV